MKILIVTPLYPPDTEPMAKYVKELAKRLSVKHKIAILTYGHIPEKVSDVNVITVGKNKPILVRLFLFTMKLLIMSFKKDIIYVQNGPSVEIPIGFLANIIKKLMVLRIGDEIAEKRSYKNKIIIFFKNIARKKFKFIIKDSPLQKPELFPFKEAPSKKLEEYQKSWDEHIDSLNKIFQNAKS